MCEIPRILVTKYNPQYIYTKIKNESRRNKNTKVDVWLSPIELEMNVQERV